MIKVEELKTETSSGLLIYHRYEDVGYDTQAIFVDDGVISDFRIGERRSRSGMQLEHVYCTLKNVDWSKYPEDTTAQQKIVNAFVAKFKDFQREGRGCIFIPIRKATEKQ